MGLRKKKLGERIGAGLVQLKGNEENPQVFSIISDNILSFDYHYDDIYNQLGRFMCFSEYDENGKMTKKADCCKVFKKRQDRVLIPVIHYDGKKKTYQKLADAKVKYLSITTYKYNDLCKTLDDAGVTFEDCDVDILLKCEDEKRGKISFDVIDGEGAFWKTQDDMIKMVKDAMETYEEDIMASLPVEYSPEHFAELIEEAKESSRAPEGVEDPDDDEIPKKKKKSKAKVEKDLDDDLDDEDEDEIPKKKKKKSVKEQIEEEDFDNEDLDEDDDEDEDEDEAPKKKKKKKVEDEDEDLDDEDDEDEKPKKKKKKVVEEDEDEDDPDDEDDD